MGHQTGLEGTVGVDRHQNRAWQRTPGIDQQGTREGQCCSRLIHQQNGRGFKGGSEKLKALFKPRQGGVIAGASIPVGAQVHSLRDCGRQASASSAGGSRVNAAGTGRWQVQVCGAGRRAGGGHKASAIGLAPPPLQHAGHAAGSRHSRHAGSSTPAAASSVGGCQLAPTLSLQALTLMIHFSPAATGRPSCAMRPSRRPSAKAGKKSRQSPWRGCGRAGGRGRQEQ